MSLCVRQFVARLSGEYRTVLVLRHMEGLKVRETAEVLGCSVPTAKMRLHRAREMLRGALKCGCRFSYDERDVLVYEPLGRDEEPKPYC